VREYGQIANIPVAMKAAAVRLARSGSELRFRYEAGPCDYGIERQLAALGQGCVVVAPSLISRRPSDRIKTDRREAINTAVLNETLEGGFRHRYLGFRPSNDEQASSAAA
jgi:transposase